MSAGLRAECTEAAALRHLHWLPGDAHHRESGDLCAQRPRQVPWLGGQICSPCRCAGSWESTLKVVRGSKIKRMRGHKAMVRAGFARMMVS